MADSLLSWYWNLNLLLMLAFVLWTGIKLLSRWSRLQLGSKARLLWARRVFAGVAFATMLLALAPQWPWAQSLKAGLLDEWTAVAGVRLLPQEQILDAARWSGYQLLLPALVAGWIWQLASLITQWRKLKHIVAESVAWRTTPVIQLFVSSTIAVPFATRALGKYLVVLPERLLATPLEMRLATRHELQHARNGDLDWLLGLEALRVLCFWNPLLHAWMREFEVLHELACDEALVVERRVDAQAYGNCLLEVAQYQCSPALGASAMVPLLRRFRNNNNLLRRRIMQLGNFRKEKYSYAKSALFGVLVAGGLCGGSLLIAADVPAPARNTPNLLPVMRVSPDYPAEALSQGAEGWVRLQFSVDDEGRVYAARVMESCAGPKDERCILNVPLFADVALKALRGWRYESLEQNGTAARENIQTILRFQLDDE